MQSTANNTSSSSSLLNDEEMQLVRVAFDSLNPDPATGRVPLESIYKRFFTAAHPRVREGSMAHTAARDTLTHHFGLANQAAGGITLREFIVYHEKLVDEAFDEQVGDLAAFVADTIMGIWRLGDLLLPTGIRPAFPIDQAPVGLYATKLMTLVWPEKDEKTGEFILRGIKEVVQPIFKRGDIPEELQGLFAYPEELSGVDVQYISPQISIKRWLDFVWEYETGKYCAVEGIVSARVDLDTLPSSISQFILEHRDATAKKDVAFLPPSVGTNPMYKRSSAAIGYGVDAETQKVVDWKMRSLAGTAYGLQYRGLRGNFFGKMKGPMQTNAATGINM